MRAARWKAALALAAALIATSAVAQQPAMVRVRGTIESVDGQMLNVKARDGAMLKVKVADKAVIRTVANATEHRADTGQ